MVAEAGFEPHDLWVMSPTSYRTAPLRDIWCRRSGSNRHEIEVSRDFKSRASAYSATPAYSAVGAFHPRFAYHIIPQPFSFVNTLSRFFVKNFFPFLVLLLVFSSFPPFFCNIHAESARDSLLRFRIFYRSSRKYGNPRLAGG